MASQASRKDRQPLDRTEQPSRAGKLMTAVAVPFLGALGEALLARAKEERCVKPTRRHWEDVVDLHAAAWPLKKNPSSWSQRVTIAIGVWLVAYAYTAGGYPPGPGYQNLIVVGALVCALGIIPTDCLEPTYSWREYYANQRCE